MNTVNVSDLSPEILALLAASYGKPADKVVESVVRKASKPGVPAKPSKLAAVKAAAVDAAPAVATPKAPVTLIELPPVGTHDARSFLVAMRRSATRDQSIQAIAGYCGFDRHGDYGSQELSARMKAQREIRGVVALPRPHHTAAPMARGFVTGMPDPRAVKLGDLRGREILAAEALATHEQNAKDHMARGDQANAVIEAQLALVERGRLNQIQADIRDMG